MLLLSACQNKSTALGIEYGCARTIEKVSDKSNIVIKENENYISIDNASKDTIIASFEISDLAPNQLYSFRFEANSKKGVAEDIIDINAQNINDVNSDCITAGMKEKTKSSLFIKQLLKTNESGKCTIKATYTLSGAVEVLNPVINKIENDNDYYICETEKDVKLIILKDDMKKNNISKNELFDLCAEVSKLRKSIKWLCNNYEPFNGVTDIVFTENNHYSALAGNPIYINREELNLFFNKSDKANIHKTDGIAILCHEISHTFDKDIYCFDEELFATLKQIFALKENGYNIDYNYLMNTPKLSSGIYNHEVVLRQIIEKLELLDSDWVIIKETLQFLENSEKLFLNKQEKFNAFITELSKKSGVAIFSEEELKSINTYFLTDTSTTKKSLD